MWTRFKTLLLREWMQHHRGWLLVMLAPPLLFLVLLPFGSIEVPKVPSTVTAAMALAISAVLISSLSWGVAMLQLPGLARRDQQDRSIEFWLSLPASHSESIAATLLAHVLLVPLLALLLGSAMGVVIATGVVVGLDGLAALSDLDLGSLALAALAGTARLALGLVLMSLWLAPLFMLLMAASAWFKRLGVPLVLATVGIGGLILDKLYGMPIVWNLLAVQTREAMSAYLDHQGEFDHLAHATATLGSASVNWAVKDSISALQALASPHLLGGLLVATGCFGLLVLRRRSSK